MKFWWIAAPIFVMALYVALQRRVLGAFLRKHSPPKLLSDDGSRFRRGVAVGAGSVAVLVVLVPLVWLATCARPGPARMRVVPPPAAGSAKPASDAQEGMQVWIETRSGRQSAVTYLHEQSSHSRSALFRNPRVFVKSPPPPVKSLPGATRIALPSPVRHAWMSVHQAVRAVVAAPDGRMESERSSSSGASAPSAANVGSAAAAVQTRGSEAERPGAGALVSLGSVSALLHYAAGVTSPQAVGAGILLRAAPSAGALYPVDVYVGVRAVNGIDPGVYYYDPHQHALLRTGDADAVRRMAHHVADGRRVAGAPLTLVLGATFDRTVAKYRSRAYRYVALDAGHIAAHLALTGAALGLRCEPEPLFEDEPLAEIVGAGSGEGALLLLSCGSKVASGAIHRGARLSIPAHQPPELPQDLDARELSRLSHRVTSWRLLDQERRELDLTAVPAAPRTEPVSLPAPAPAQADLFEVIAARRSFREFTPRAVAADQLAGVLADAYAFAPRVRSQAFIELYVFVRAVDSIAPGLYRYHPALQALERVRAGEVAAEIQSAGFSQELLGRAAFVLAWVARIDVVEKTDGARGYRHALLDVGLAGAQAYLSATGRRLGICGVGAFYDDAVNRLLGSENGTRVALYLQGVGHRE